MQSQGILSSAKRRCKLSTEHLFAAPGQTRAAILTASQLASYSEVKAMTKQLTGWDDGLALHISCSMVAGLVSTTATSPGACNQEPRGHVWITRTQDCMLLVQLNDILRRIHSHWLLLMCSGRGEVYHVHQ